MGVIVFCIFASFVFQKNESEIIQMLKLKDLRNKIKLVFHRKDAKYAKVLKDKKTTVAHLFARSTSFCCSEYTFNLFIYLI